MGELRRLLSSSPGIVLETAARALGRPPRSLQRELERDGSTFRAEVERARVELAKTLLSTTDLKLEVIAQRVDCSAASLARLFRRLTGESPSDYRRLERGGAKG